MTDPEISSFEVTTDDAQTTVSSVQPAVEEIESQLSTLRAFVSATSDYWQGFDQVALAELMQTFDSDAAALNNALDSIAGGLRSTATNYDDAGARNKSSFTATHQNLPPRGSGTLSGGAEMTAAGRFMVKGERVQAGPSVAAQSARIYELLQSLRSRTSALAATWTGAGASQSYQDLQRQWDSAGRSLFGDGTLGADSVLGSIAANLNRIAANGASTEHANLQTSSSGICSSRTLGRSGGPIAER